MIATIAGEENFRIENRRILPSTRMYSDASRIADCATIEEYFPDLGIHVGYFNCQLLRIRPKYIPCSPVD